MSMIPKHFGLKYKDESYMLKELEKVRKETKKEFLRFKQKLAYKATVEQGLVHGPQGLCQTSPGERRRISHVGSQKPFGSPPGKGPATPPAAFLRKAPQGSARPPGPREAGDLGKTRPFRPQDFYLRSSAFLRHRLQKKPPVIAPGAGTSKPAILLPPPAPPLKPRVPQVLGASRPEASRHVINLARERYATQAAAIFAEVCKTRERKASSTSSQVSDAGLLSRRRRVRIRTHPLREYSMCEVRETAESDFSKTNREMIAQRNADQLPVRVIPTSIEEIIASLQSEAQLASDQAIKELIQSVLGQNYDIKMEDVSLMGKMQWHKTSQAQSEHGLQISAEELQMQNMLEELPEAVSSIFQIEQEDPSEWGALETGSLVLKPQEVQPTEESYNLLGDEQSTNDSKAAERVSLKVLSSEFLQIKGKEVKRMRKTKSEFQQLRPRKLLKSSRDQKLAKKTAQDYPSPSLHELCTTIPAHGLPIDLHLASRVYHTAGKKGHDTLLGILGTFFSHDHSTDEEQRDRLLFGIPVTDYNQENVAVPPTIPEKPPELTQETGQHSCKPHLRLLGKEVCAYSGLTKLFWYPAAPKFSVPVSVMKETLYPKYESAQTSRILTEKYSSESKESVINSSQHSRKPVRKTKSAVDLRKQDTIAPLAIHDDTQSNIKGVRFQKAKELERQMAEKIKPEEPATVKENIDVILDNIQNKSSLRHLSLSLIEASRQAGISYIVYPKKKKMCWKKELSLDKLASIYEELSKPPRILKRSLSHGMLHEQKKYLLKVPLYERQIRCPSLPSCLDFEEFARSKGGIPENIDAQTWAISMWSKHKIQPKTTEKKIIKIALKRDESAVKEPPKIELSNSLCSDLPPEVIKYYESEVEILTKEINEKKKFSAFSYCRRGAIYRKLGKLKSAMNDLQEAIFLEPLFLNAYWHRHFIYLFQDKINEALDDLNFINKYNKNNAEAYLSKAEIFRQKNDITLAILNYTQAIKCKPTDADTYFRRGEMYEKSNQVLAIDDFSKCIFYDPKRTDALLKRGMFYFENENWISAIQDFTALLNIDHQNSHAWTYRGRAYFKRHFYKQATQDLSAAIHLDPNNWLALYYRGCLFRKSNPLRALQDYSLSALINDGYENLSSFLHRGIVYADQRQWLLAVCDFETVISLERTFSLAYINIGLIYLLHLDNYVEAIWQFTEAIRFDPLYIQSYLCRAEAYHKLHKLKNSIRDLSCAIHLQPDGIQLYIIRGQYLLKMKQFDLAKFTIYQVAEMDKGLIELSPIQQALIYSFCENHDKAIQVLHNITVSKPEITMYALLAKAQMKAKRNKEAVKTFKKALDVFAHSDKGPTAVEASADCLYHLGLCYMEEGNLQTAFDSFTKAVKVNPDFAEGFYQRGLCKVKLHKDNSILDFNRAITLNPKHYQAYLSRVAYYGLKGRYSKAILNCNEAIKIYPESVRAYIYRGVLKYYNKAYKLAITDLTIAINMDRNSYIAFYNRAICYTKINELQMALTDYSVVLLLDAGETVMLNTFINRGRIYAELEQYGFALEDFKQAALISQTNVSLCQASAMCHHRINEFEDAVSFFTCALKINPNFVDAYVGRGNSYMEYGHDEATKQAQKDFVKALHFNPVYTKARISLGYNLQAQGKFQKAWNHFTIALEIDPKSYKAYEGRSVICLQMSNTFAAIQDINTALKINTTAEFLTNRGVIHEFMGQQQNAMKDYQAAISLNPKYSLAYFNAGNIYFHHRQFSQANDYFSKALQFDPKDECALMNRAVTNTILKKYEEAKEDFANVIDNCPFWAAVYFNRANFYYCLKQYEVAEADLCKALTLKPNDAFAYSLRAEVRGKIGLIEKAMADYNQALDLQEYASVM
ncbi:tetratricopeptide repeat protein 6 [Orycteropus afer afer]|uniref:Tetratricopeptide repeat protein 6 n=1 Tax=Orycteropus afer afer TaxID=1230840 RepID=A0A8B6ZS66_ORYAF|nr:tetratricopeptide repeat protein 6 [Orycteropus afer afer]